MSRNREALTLFLGDIFFLFVSLFLMLLINYLRLPDEYLLKEHLGAFSVLFVVWIIVFYIAGLYEKHTVLFKNKLPTVILNTQVINTFIAVLFFYLIPSFGITPKTNLFIYLIVSFVLMLSWRIYGYQFVGSQKKEKAIIIGGGEELSGLINEINNNSIYGFYVVQLIDIDTAGNFEKEVLNQVINNSVTSIIIDFENENVNSVLPKLFPLLPLRVEFFDAHRLYEDIFDRVPLSLLGYKWFLENISLSPKPGFDFFKRVMDVVISSVLLILSSIFYPFVFLALKLEDRGSLFIFQERVGQGEKKVKIFKFRSMTGNDEGEDVLESRHKVTKAGKFLRKTRIDELPQLWNVLRGDLSLIGPRPELPALAKHYEESIPYYNVRHLIKPGLSGWAQIYHDSHPHHGTDIIETKAKLSYDLYYIKNRSIMLDLKIALRTIRSLLSRSGV